MSVKMIDSQIVVSADAPVTIAPVVVVDPAMPLPANVAKDAARFAGIMAAGGDISMPLADLPPAPVMPSIANADADAQLTARAGTLPDLPHAQEQANTVATTSDGAAASPGGRPAVSSQNSGTASVATSVEGDAGDTPDARPAQVQLEHEDHPIQGGKRASASPDQPQQVATDATDATDIAPTAKATTDKNATPADEGTAPQSRTAETAHAVSTTKTKGSRAVLTPAQMQARDHKRKTLGLDGGLPGQVQSKEAPAQSSRASASRDTDTTNETAAAVAAAGAVVAAQPTQMIAAAAPPASAAGVKATSGAERSAAARDHVTADHAAADHSLAAATTAEVPAQHESQAALHAQGPAHAADAALAHSHAAIFTSGAAPIANTHAQGPAHAADAAIAHAQAPIFAAAAAATAATAAAAPPVATEPVVTAPIIPVVTDPVATDPVVATAPLAAAPLVTEPIAADAVAGAPFAIEMLDAATLDAEVSDAETLDADTLEAQAPSDSSGNQIDMPPGAPPAPVQIQREQLVVEAIVAQIQAQEMHIAAVNTPASPLLDVLEKL